MTDRTTINVDKETHSEAKDTKQEYGETWPEVLEFYAEYRSQVSSENPHIPEDYVERLERLDRGYERPDTDPVDYGKMETLMENVIERTLR